MENKKTGSTELSSLELERAKQVLKKLKEGTDSKDDPTFFCNGHNQITKEGLALYNSESGKKLIGKLKEEAAAFGNAKDKDIWFCNGHNK